MYYCQVSFAPRADNVVLISPPADILHRLRNRARKYEHPYRRPSCVTVTTLPRTLTLKL
jgi:hypothetical protein